jgi:hypothetical protein
LQPSGVVFAAAHLPRVARGPGPSWHLWHVTASEGWGPPFDSGRQVTRIFDGTPAPGAQVFAARRRPVEAPVPPGYTAQIGAGAAKNCDLTEDLKSSSILDIKRIRSGVPRGRDDQ